MVDDDLIQPGTPAYRRACLALVVASLVVFANLYAIHPLLPLIAQHFAVGTLQAGNAFTITSLTLGVSLLLHGPLSDAFGRKGPLLVGVAAAGVLSLAMAFTDSFAILLALRAALGVALGVLPAIAVAYLGDTMTRTALVGAVGLYIGGNTLGGAGGRLLGGFVAEHFGLQAVFIFLGLASLAGLLIIAMLLPAARSFRAQPFSLAGSARGLIAHLRNRRLLPAFLLGGLNFMIFLNLYTFLAFRLSEAPWQLGSGALGLLFLTYLAGTLSASLSGRIPVQSLLRGMTAGLVLLCAGTLMLLSDKLWAILLGLLLNASGFFLTHSLTNTWVNRQAEFGKASASSLYSVFYYLGAAFGLYYLDAFWRLGQWPYVIAASLGVLLFNLLIIAYLGRLQRCAAGPM